MPNYQYIVLVKETRYSDNGCNCFICLTARKKGKYNMNKLEAGVQKIGIHCIQDTRQIIFGKTIYVQNNDKN